MGVYYTVLETNSIELFLISRDGCIKINSFLAEHNDKIRIVLAPDWRRKRKVILRCRCLSDLPVLQPEQKEDFSGINGRSCRQVRQT